MSELPERTVEAATDLGLRLKAERTRRGVGLRQAAEETGVSFNTLSRIERGRDCWHRHALAIDAWVGGPDRLVVAGSFEREVWDRILSGLNLCAAHQTRDLACRVCCPDLTALVAEHRRLEREQTEREVIEKVCAWLRGPANEAPLCVPGALSVAYEMEASFLQSETVS